MVFKKLKTKLTLDFGIQTIFFKLLYGILYCPSRASGVYLLLEASPRPEDGYSVGSCVAPTKAPRRRSSDPHPDEAARKHLKLMCWLGVMFAVISNYIFISVAPTRNGFLWAAGVATLSTAGGIDWHRWILRRADFF